MNALREHEIRCNSSWLTSLGCKQLSSVNKKEKQKVYARREHSRVKHSRLLHNYTPQHSRWRQSDLEKLISQEPLKSVRRVVRPRQRRNACMWNESL